MPPLEVLENVVRGVSGCHSKCESLQAFVGTQYGARRNFCCPSFLFEKYCFSVFTPRYRRSPPPWIVWYEEPDLPQPLRVAFRVSAPASPLGTVPAQHQHPLSLEGSWWCFGQKRCSRGRGRIAALSPAAHPLCPPFTLFFCRLRAWRCARNATETPSPHFVSRL